MKPHKWAKEIKAWADGAEIEHRIGDCWRDCEKPVWGEQTEYRIKPQPKEPQYLYVYEDNTGWLAHYSDKNYEKATGKKYLGKIKLEDE